MNLKDILLRATRNVPNAAYIRQKIIGNLIMSNCQKIIAAIFNLTEKEEYGFYVAYEPALIETIIEAAELPMNGDSYKEIKSQLHTPTMMTALKGIGVEVTRSKGDYLTVWGPGVKKS